MGLTNCIDARRQHADEVKLVVNSGGVNDSGEDPGPDFEPLRTESHEKGEGDGLASPQAAEAQRKPLPEATRHYQTYLQVQYERNNQEAKSRS